MSKGRWLGRLCFVVVLANAGCGGEDLARSGSAADTPGAGVERPVGTRTVDGVKLTHVDVTATHRVEFWQTHEGGVMLLQRLNTQAGDESLDLGPMMLDAGGTYAGLYRRLMHDPNATISPELAAADERRAHLPIRDASQPRPLADPPPHATRTHGAAVVAPAPTSTKPGTLHTEWLSGLTDAYNYSGITNFDCSAPEVDAAWCPPGAYYSYIYGESDESIFYDSIAYNPQGQPTTGSGSANDDRYTVSQWTAARGWFNVLNWDLWPGETLRTTFVDMPSYYWGEVDGNVVAFSDRQRRSFSSLSFGYSDPSWNMDDGSFGNDIEGLAHGYHATTPDYYVDPTGTLWFESRTQFSSGKSQYGQIGVHGLLGGGGPASNCTFSEPNAWHGNPNYVHYGDIAYEPPRSTVGDRTSSGFVLVSLNAVDNTHAGVGFLGYKPNAGCGVMQDWGTVQLSATEQAPCVALTDKYLYHSVNGVYEGQTVAHIYVPSSLHWNALHEYMVDYSSTPKVIFSRDVSIVNAGDALTVINAPNGMKVSSHGKLYVWGVATTNTVGRLYGIDPFSGLIQVQFDMTYGHPSSVGYTPKIESEGLDIIDTKDVGLTRAAPEIVVQSLANMLGTDVWTLMHVTVNDASRL